jgi:LacI family transcriptional regulator
LRAEPGRRRVTISDVAARCGVSTSAVSNVLRHAYGVSPAMKAKVEAAIAELGYRPHAGARAMRGNTFTLGVLVPDLHNPFIASVVDAINEHMNDTRYVVLIGTGRATAEDQRRTIEGMVDRQVDGLILIAPEMSQQWLDDLASTVPTVVLGRHGRASAYDTVVGDDFHGAQLVVDHLVELGHHRIAHLAHSGGGLRRPHVLPQTARVDGYRQRMQERGLEAHINVITTSYTEEGGYIGAASLLRQTPRPTAIFVGADIAALGVLRAVDEAGLVVPGDVSLASYDNSSIAALPQISLTSVDQEAHLVGDTAARLLIERMDGRTAPVQLTIAPHLVVRRTSMPLNSTPDPQANAVDFATADRRPPR